MTASNRLKARASRIRFATRKSAKQREEEDIRERLDRAYVGGRHEGAETERRKHQSLCLPSDFTKAVVDRFADHLAREALENARRAGKDGEFLYIVKAVATEFSQSLRGEPLRYGQIQSFVRWRMDSFDTVEFGVDLPAMNVRLSVPSAAKLAMCPRR